MALYSINPKNFVILTKILKKNLTTNQTAKKKRVITLRALRLCGEKLSLVVALLG